MISKHTKDLMRETIVWDNHACMPLRPEDKEFLPQLEKFRSGGVNVVALNVVFDAFTWELAIRMLVSFRQWVSLHPDKYLLAHNVTDILRAKSENKLAIFFDIEGGRAVEEDPGFVELFYQLGVRWMLIAYNQNNKLGGGCLDDDQGLTDYGRQIIREMERIGMLVCCSHTGHKTARDVMDFAQRPVIFSHSNPSGLHAHSRNIPDDLIRSCAKTGGIININGIGIFLGDNDNSTDTLLKHIDYTVNLVGPKHVGIALDYLFDPAEFEDFVKNHPELFLSNGPNGAKGAGGDYSGSFKTIEPERFPAIAEGLLKMGYCDDDVKGILGHNNLRLAQEIWR